MNTLPVDPVELARDLIRCPSVTPHEAGALSLLAGVLEKQGFQTELVTFTEPGTADVVNLYARIGSGSPCFVFAGHTDVVPTGDEAAWSHAPFSGEILDGVLWGRGACDMKGGVAAAAAAAAAFVAQRGTEFGGSIAFLVTGDEEGPSINGMPKLLKWAAERGETFDHCLLGEPTNPTVLGEAIKIGRRGSMSGTIVVEGRQGHVAYPHLADNPIPGLMRLCAALIATPLDEGSDHFAPSNLEIVSIDVGNPVFNIIPREARAKFNIRMNDRHGIDSLTARIEAILAQAGAEVKYRLEIAPGASASFLTQPDDFVALVADAVEQETGTRPALSTSGGTSDARHIKDHMTVLEFGLVGQTMHQVDERAPVTDIERLAVIYRRVLERYFAS